MGLILNQETSDRVSEAVLPPRMGRNEACHCGSAVALSPELAGLPSDGGAA
jgi:hypothetical protein